MAWLPELLRSAALARAFTLTVLGAVFSSWALQHMAGLVTYATIVVCLCALGAAMLAARHREIAILRLVPTSLLVYAAWTLISVMWSTSRGDTLAGWLSLVAIAFLAVVIGHVRDTLQTLRALGDVMRVLLSVSLALEIVIGILLPQPLHILDIEGNITSFGPVQGIFGTRNALGFVAVLALVTFIVEWRTASVRPGLALYSVCVGGLMAALSGSPTVLVVAVAVLVASAVLALVRRAPARDRAPLQWGLGVVVALSLVVGYIFRHQLIAWIGATTDFSIRTDLWRVLSVFVKVQPVEGFGWFGAWPQNVYPFVAVNAVLGDHNDTALNAYADLVIQVGWAGLAAFAVMAGTAMARSWMAAGERRSIVYAWVPLLLVTLGVVSLFESFMLFSAGWLILVICVVRAGQTSSWRSRMDASTRPPTDLMPGPH